MNTTKFIQDQWADFTRQWLAMYNDARLSLAITLADYKYNLSGRKIQYFILPNERDRLLVLSLREIEKLKSVQEVKFRAVFRRKLYIRKRKNSGRNKKILRLKIVGRKAFGISRMDRRVKELDVRRECFYHTPLLGDDKLPIIAEQKKRAEWIKYSQDARMYQKKARQKRRAKK